MPEPDSGELFVMRKRMLRGFSPVIPLFILSALALSFVLADSYSVVPTDTPQAAAVAEAEPLDFFTWLYGSIFGTKKEIDSATPLPAPAPRPVSLPVSERTPAPTPASSPPMQTVINNPVVERIKETVVVQGSGVSDSTLEARLAALRSELIGRIPVSSPIAFSGPSYSTPVSVQTFAVAQKIDQLGDIDLIGVRVNGISGLTDADVPDGITASSYLPLSGGTLSGNLSIGGTLSVSSLSSGGATEGPYFTATSTTASSTFPNLLSTNATTTNATSTNHSISGSLTLTPFSLGGLAVSAAGKVYGFATSTLSTISGLLSVASGGTGWDNLQANAILLGNGTGRIATTTAGTNGQTLALVSGVPTWVATTTLATITGTLTVDKGGTGAITFTNNRLLTGNGTSALIDEANLTFDGSLLAITGNASTTQMGSTGSSYFATAGGNVGIGTSTPGLKLDVFGDNGNGYSARFVSAAGVSSLGVKTTNSITGLQGLNSTGSNVAAISLNATGGFVSVGTSTAYAPLSVLGDTGAPSQGLILTTNSYVQGSAGSYLRFGHGASSGSTYGVIDNIIGGGASFGNLVLQQAGGNVGIGTTTPAQKLEAYGGNGSYVVSASTNSANSGYNWTGFKIRGHVNSVPSEWNLLGGSFLGGAASDFQISQDSTSKFYIVGATGNVGIGSTSPSKKLVVDGAIGFTAGNYIGSGLGWDGTASGAAASSTIQLYSLSDGGMTLASGLLKFQTSGSERMRIDSSGNLGIGTAAPANYAGYTTLTLNHATNGGIIDFQNNGTRKGEIYNTASDFGVYADTGVTLNFWAGAANYADIDTAGNFVWSQTNTSGGNTGLCYDGSGASVWGSCTSLAAYKENVEDLELGLETVLALRPVTFDWKSSGTPDLGFIAEEVEEVNSLLAEHGGRDGTLSGVKYNTMSALLVRAFQELYTGFISRFTRQDEKLDALEERIQTLEALVAGAGISGSLNSPPPPESRQPSPEPAVEESSAEPTSIEAPALEPMPETENILTEEKPQVPTAEEIPPSE